MSELCWCRLDAPIAGEGECSLNSERSRQKPLAAACVWADFKFEERAGKTWCVPGGKRLPDSMMAALETLDGEGCLGGDQSRRRRRVFAHVYDHEQSRQMRNRSIETFNAGKTSPALIEDFRDVRRV